MEDRLPRKLAAILCTLMAGPAADCLQYRLETVPLYWALYELAA